MSLIQKIKSKTHFDSTELLIKGDNLSALYLLRENPEFYGKIKLVYIDPPYGTGQSFTVSEKRVSTISRSKNGKLAYNDLLLGKDYLEFLRPRLVAIRDLMSDDGSIYLHIDCKMGHYVKCLMDEVFGETNFINDITRIKCNPKNFARKGFGNVKDMILFYGKTKKVIWNEPKLPVLAGDLENRFKSTDKKGRSYTTTPLHAPGETLNGATGKKWRNMLPPAGRHWRYSPIVLEELDAQGLIEWSSTGNPRKIIYADDVRKRGTKVQDVWEFKDPQSPLYPTEKNLNMLKLIIAASSNQGDVVMDAFCGSGSTLLAARQLGRKWIGIDVSPEAITLSRKRLSGSTFLDLSNSRGVLLK